jgi:hypothetical protein
MMSISPELRRSLVDRVSRQDPSLDRAVLGRIVDEVASSLTASRDPGGTAPSPFDVSWMDSYVAHWTLGRSVAPTSDHFEEVAQVLRDALDARFEEHKAEILRWIGRLNEPPDGGPPEPGTPPVGPSVFEPPDGGPPEPGTPPVGPDVSFLGDNPWILYWFISLKAPMLLDVLDAHLTRRLEELGFQRG